MRFNLAVFFKTTLLSAVLAFSFSVSSWAEAVDKDFEDKLYRQALYFYFTGNYSEALRKISVNRQRFTAKSSRSQLFEAGLQVSVGLHNQATQTLYKLAEKQTSIEKNASLEKNTDKGSSATSPEELMLIALLQLAEQQVQQGENKTAQQTLSQITQVSNVYSDQYQVLNQLAYWPKFPVQLAKLGKTETSNQQLSTSPYIALNQALLHIELNEFELAESILISVKNKRWQAPVMSFWQLLFSPFSGDADDEENANLKGMNVEGAYVGDENAEIENNEEVQQQAVNDYAQLLLAKMYVKQTRYEAAYYELKNFPQDSPYTETALFIFAFSAQKIKQYTTSFKLLDLMQERYPYSNLGWQAALLFSEQVTNQKTLEKGITSYQNAEHLYQQRLTELAEFHHNFDEIDNVLNFASSKKNITATDAALILPLFRQNTYRTDSVWLKKALLDVELQTHYQTLIELDLLTTHLQGEQQKSQWLKDTLRLNNTRKAKVIELQKNAHYSSIITSLNNKKQQLAKIIEQAESEQLGQAFANQTEVQWLKRIKESKQVITSIKGHRSTDDYQKRLSRIEGVLAWQLQRELPDRLWRHKKQLKEINQQLILAKQQKKRFAALVSAQQLKSGIAGRVQRSSGEVIDLLDKVAQLRVKTSKKIQTNVQRFVDNQRSLLEQHLLTCRHEMAAALEKMSELDKRIEQQLAPNVNASVDHKGAL